MLAEEQPANQISSMYVLVLSIQALKPVFVATTSPVWSSILADEQSDNHISSIYVLALSI